VSSYGFMLAAPHIDDPLPPLWGKEGMGGDAALRPNRHALYRARAAIAAPPPIQLRLSSLPLAKAPHPSPARGEGVFGVGAGA
jgi:hypothetical protein